MSHFETCIHIFVMKVLPNCMRLKWHFSKEKALRSMGRIVPVYLDRGVVSGGICHPHTIGHFETRNTGYRGISLFWNTSPLSFSFFLHDSLLGRYHGFFIKNLWECFGQGNTLRKGGEGGGGGSGLNLHTKWTFYKHFVVSIRLDACGIYP